MRHALLEKSCIRLSEPVQFSTKVHEVYTDVTLLSNTLSKLLSTQRQRRRRNDFLHDAFTISSFSTIDSFTRSETAFTTSKVPFSTSSDNTNNTKRQEAEFMYSQFLQGILIEISSTQEELIKFCRTKYDGDESQLNYIEQFEDYYIPSSAVYWYTRDTFLYRLLNKALREYDIDTLYPLRYYIKDLHSQLKEKHASQQQLLKIIAILCDTSDRTVAIVYRGQLMANVEFDEKILQKKGGFFSVSSFLSTTCVKHLASIYAGEDGGSGVDSNSQRILFEIVIDKSVNKFPYANISADSAFDENENEILFTMGAVFRILSICQNGEGIWMVQLKLTGEEDKELRTLTEYMRNDIINCYPLISLAQLMEVMGYHSKAAQFYRSLLGDQKIKEDYNALSNVHNNLGLMYRHMGKELDAIKHYEKSLEIILPHSSSKDPRAAVTYNNLGTIYLQQNDFDKALSYFKKALAIYSSATILKPSVAVKTINNIGMCYYEQREYQKALDMYLEALGIQFNNLPHNHPDIATTYNNISIVYNDLKDYKNAVEYMKKALQIESISLSSDHSSLSRIYSNLSDALFKDGFAGLSRNSSTGPIASGRTFVDSAYKQNLTIRPSISHLSTPSVPLKHLHRRQLPDCAPERTTKRTLRRRRRQRLEVRIATGSGSCKKPPDLQSSVRLATPRHVVEEPVAIEPCRCFSPRGEISEGSSGESPDARTPDRVSDESFSADSTEEGMLLDRSPDDGVSDLDELAARHTSNSTANSTQQRRVPPNNMVTSKPPLTKSFLRRQRRNRNRFQAAQATNGNLLLGDNRFAALAEFDGQNDNGVDRNQKQTTAANMSTVSSRPTRKQKKQPRQFVAEDEDKGQEPLSKAVPLYDNDKKFSSNAVTHALLVTSNA
ncbi:unnamed protein product [Didymodactylos carnosus]|uniref:Kinesin light chain n=1 Tax=Didymodactylos carnosus TaxID=1234261 RepID=A0A8S2D3B5_9BILA|nr:unnamed protein product [Didymodactylos carnosus]CAF3612197.1 unnamed protein product [Didymodactylos carnosus]